MAIYLKKAIGLDVSEVKTEGEAGVFKGYASKFNGNDSYGDTILPGAYAEAIQSVQKLPIFLNHATDEVPIGVYSLIKEDEKGLYVEGALTLGIQKARDVLEAIKAGSLNGLSVGIFLKKNDYELKDPDDIWSGRVIRKVSGLREISVCTYPADDRARIHAVKTEPGAKTVRDLEEMLRDAGFSKSDAMAFISNAKAIILDEKRRRDSETEVEKTLVAKILKVSQSLN